MKTPEGLTKADIKKYLDGNRPDCYYFMPVQMGYGKRTLDFLICWRGQFIACEAKKKGGKAQAFQRKIARDINAAGGIALIVDRIEQLIDQLLRSLLSEAD